MVLVVGVTAPARAAGGTYKVDPVGSAVTIHVGKGGLFKFAGHEHEVLAPAFEGEVHADGEDLARSSVRLTFETAAITVSGKGEPPEDVPKVQEAMVGPKVLDVSRFPRVTFQSRSVSGHKVSNGVYDLQIVGDLALRGVTRTLTIPVRVEVSAESLVATGRVTLQQSAFGLEPFSVAGVVKVKDELAIDLRIVARLGP